MLEVVNGDSFICPGAWQITGRGWDKTGRRLGFSVQDIDKRLTLFKRSEGSDRDQEGKVQFREWSGPGPSAREGDHLGSITLGQGVGQAAHQEAAGRKNRAAVRGIVIDRLGILDPGPLVG